MKQCTGDFLQENPSNPIATEALYQLCTKFTFAVAPLSFAAVGMICSNLLNPLK